MMDSFLNVWQFLAARGQCRHCNASVWWLDKRCSHCRGEHPAARPVFYWMGWLIVVLGLLCVPVLVALALGIIK
ncbi:MAG TPA: hypothetical protein VEJ63_00860 [Planctomycetota bacterium]|nr:hypothetical protein [Planctomycetota bacterium]